MGMLRYIRMLSMAAVLTVAAGGLTDCRKADVDVTPAEVKIENDQEPVAIEISTTSPWTIECEQTWVTASPTSGNGSATVYLTALANTTGAIRQTRVLVNAGRAESLVSVPVTVTQPPMLILFSVDTVSVPKEGGTVEFEVLTDGPWSILEDISWVESIEPLSGLGNTRISVTGGASDKRRYQYGNLIFKTGSMNVPLPVCLQPLDNQSPDIPQLKFPTENAEGVSVMPSFSWKCSDPDGDKLSYTLLLSNDQSYWNSYTTTAESYTLDNALDVQGSYWWKVLADDGNGRENSVSESDVRKFTTGGKTHYADGEWILIHEASVSNPVNIVFTGDGYIREDHKLGGAFVSDMKEGVAELFSVEPYKEYENYFNVYAVAAYSEQRGMTITGQQTRRTRFNVTKVGEDRTSLTCNADTVFMYAEMIPEVKGKLDQVSIFVISNQNLYAGTCYQYLSGHTIAIIPVCRMTDPTVYTDYGSILRHEGGGHAFGRLADEYVTYAGRSLPQEGEWSVESLMIFQANDFWMNVSASKETRDMPWAELTGKEGYSAITNPQGGLYYEYGVWRSEKQSCMIDNMPYFSAAQRLSIVKRLKTLSGEEFSLDDFMARDSVRTPSSAPAAKGSFETSSFRPLAPPVLMEKR